MNSQQLTQSTWHGGQLLAFSGLDGRTDFEHGLVGRTAFGRPGIELKLPGSGAISFPDICTSVVAGDFYQLQTVEGLVQGAYLDAWHMLIQGPCRFEPGDSSIAAHSSGDRLLVGSAGQFDPSRIDASLDEALEARGQWLSSQTPPPHLPGRSAGAYTKALSIMKSQVYTLEGQIKHRWTTPDRWPHRGMWLWDSVFHAIGWRHLDLPLARELLSAVFDIQAGDGFIAHAVTPQRKSAITQPPVLALGASLVDTLSPDPAWIAALYPRLKAYLEWDLANRDSDGAGLLEWFIEADENSRSGESGMDNSPRFDRATQLDAVDFNAFLALECEIMAGFAERLGLAEDAGLWTHRYKRLCRLINKRLWSEEIGFYVDFDVERGEPSPVLSSAGFLPLICGAPSQAQAGRLAAHLQNPESFATPLRVPSIAASDVEHYAKDMWRGPVWINLNWLIAYGLKRYGFDDLAESLRRETMAVIEGGYDAYGTFFEFFDDRQEVPPPELLRKGRCAPQISPYHQVFHDYGWTATLYCDWLHDNPINRPPRRNDAQT